MATYTVSKGPREGELERGMPHQGPKTAVSVTTYCEVIQHLLGTYDSDEMYARIKADVTLFIHTEVIKEAKLEAMMWKKTLKRG